MRTFTVEKAPCGKGFRVKLDPPYLLPGHVTDIEGIGASWTPPNTVYSLGWFKRKYMARDDADKLANGHGPYVGL